MSAQEDALKRAHDILCEHFPAHVIVTRSDDEVGDKFQDINITFNGGFYGAYGMAQYAVNQMPVMFDEDEEEDETD